MEKREKERNSEGRRKEKTSRVSCRKKENVRETEREIREREIEI